MSLLRTILNSHKWMNVRQIPNRPGFKFVAKTHLGDEYECETYVRSEMSIRIGVRRVYTKIPISFKDIVRWREV